MSRITKFMFVTFHVRLLIIMIVQFIKEKEYHENTNYSKTVITN